MRLEARGEQARGLRLEAKGKAKHFFLSLLLLMLVAAPLFAAEEHQAAAPWWSLPAKFFNFLVLFGLLGYLLRKPAAEYFTARTQAIRQGMAEARRAREEAEKRLAEIEQRLTRLAEEIEALRAEAGREAAAQRENLLAAAGVEAQKILAAAEAEIGTLARAARLDLKAFTAQLAVELAEERIRSQMNPEVQGRLLSAYVEDLTRIRSGNEGGGKN